MNSIYLQDDKFNRYFAIAVLFHAGFILAVLIIHFIMGWDFFAARDFKTEVIQPSVRVDIVAMPKFTVQELKTLKARPAPEAVKEVEAPESKVVEKEVEKDLPEPKVDLGNILNTLSKKDIAPKPAKKVKGNAINKKLLDSLVLEGNKVSKGATVVGDAYAKEQTVYNTYLSSLPDYIRPHWKLPSYLLEDSSLKCRIKIYIDGSGKIMRSEIVSSSGDRQYDQLALKAVAATLFPPPAREILAKVSSGSVVLGFPL